MSSLTLLLYGRPECCLCDDAKRIVEQLRTTREFELIDINIELDDAIHARFLERIPVLAIRDDDQETIIAELDQFDLVALRKALPAQR